MILYKKGGFAIKEIYCNNEFQKVIIKFLGKQKPPIKINYAAAQEHVPRAKWNNQTIKEKAQSIYHQMPYKNLF